MNYLMEIDRKKEPVPGIDEFKRRIESALKREYFEVALQQNLGSMRGLEGLVYRLLGLATDIKGQSVYVLTRKGTSVVIFLDEDDNESRVINSEYDGPQEQVEFRLHTGERSLHPANECVSTDIAFNSLIHFVEHGEKPDWLKYRKSKS